MATRTKHVTTAANPVATVTIASTATPRHTLTVTNRNGASEAYFTTDGSAPTLEGDNTYVVPAAVGATVTVPDDRAPGAPVTVIAISASATKLTVTVNGA